MSKTQTKQCIGCKQTFYNGGAGRVSATRWNARKYCNIGCRRVETKPDYSASKVCPTCNQTFYRPMNQRGWGWLRRTYCSAKCSNSRPDRQGATKVCVVCSMEYRALGKIEKRRTCSHKCAGVLHSRQLTGSGHWNWKGGRVRNSGGYIWVYLPKSHPYHGGKRNNRILEHRLVMAEMLGRPLLDTETVHHKNAIRDDNRPENLELRTGAHGQGATRHCLTCTCTP
jgi:hypothetical protein